MSNSKRGRAIVLFTEASQETRASSFRLLEELSQLTSLTVSIPGDPLRNAGELTRTPNLTILFRPPYGDTFAGFAARLPILLWSTRRSIRNAIRNADLVVSRIPSPIVGIVDREARRQGCRHVLYIVADIESAARGGARNAEPRSLLEGLRALAARWVRRRQQRLTRGTLAIVIGEALAAQYRPFARRCERFFPTSVRESEIAARPDTCGAKPVELLHVARLVSLKGTSFLLDAVAHLVDDGRDVRLTIVGSGPLGGDLVRHAARLGLTDRIEFAGSINFDDRLRTLYQRADIFVHPSLSEAFPRVLWEAMASYTPIVATDVGSVGEVLRGAAAGLVVPPRSSRELATAIARVLDDGNLRRELIRAGGNLVRRHTVEQQARRFWELLQPELELDAGES